MVEIYFDTATFDKIERDKKIKTEAQLSLIGGTMGLLTGFSIISGIEIIYFLFRLDNLIELNDKEICELLLIMIIRFFINYIFDPIPLVTSGWSLPLGSNEANM